MRPNIPQLVYNLALKRDLAGLRKLQAKGYCLTQFHYAFHHEFNAIAKLAFDGHDETAEFLVDQLIGCVDDLVSGYAHAGNVARAKFWLPHTYDKEKIIIGFAFSNCNEAIDDIINEIQAPLVKYRLMLKAVFGYAKGGHESQVESYKVNLLTNIPPLFTEEQLNEASMRKAITRHHIMGLAENGNLRGLELANGNDVYIESFYWHLNHKRPIENTLLSEHQFLLNCNAAFFGDDDYIKNHPLIADNEPLQNEWSQLMQLAYLQGGHSSTNDITIQIDGLLHAYKEGNHTALFEAILNDPNEDYKFEIAPLELESSSLDKADYLVDSPYWTLKQLYNNGHLETTRRLLLQIHDDKKRERLAWLATGNNRQSPSKPTPESIQLENIHKIFTHTPLGFNIAHTIGRDQALLLNALGFIMISLHQSAGALNTSLVVDLILSNLLGVTEPDAVKIHSHFAGMFSKHINRLSNSQNTLTQGNNNHAPQHPAIGL